MKNFDRAAYIVLLPLMMLVSFQNCSGFLAFGEGEESASSLRLNELVPPSDKLDDNCQNSSEYDVCVFKKSPVSQSSGVVADGGVSVASLSNLQKYGVKLTGLDSSGLLKNTSIEVTTLKGTAYQAGAGKVSIASAGNATDTSVEQTMAYYWLNRAVEYLGFRSEDFAAKNEGIKVVVDDKVAGYNSTDNTIHLKKTEGQAPMAFDGGVMIYFLAQANMHFATGGKVWDLGTSETHVSCGGVKNGCCASEKGCSKAIASGAGDYLVAVMFPDDPKLGEAWLNKTEGAGYCGQTRDLNSAAKMTTATAYAACNATGGDGEIHTLGTVYASIWWEVRSAAEDAKEIDQLYFRHLESLRGSDTFDTMLRKIKSADTSLFSGKYYPAFEKEFSSRGL